MEAKVVSVSYVPGRAYTGVTLTAKRAPGYDYVGEFVAFDPVTGKRAWAYRAPGGAAMTASALATAGGVVFGGTADRQFFALDTRLASSSGRRASTATSQARRSPSPWVNGSSSRSRPEGGQGRRHRSVR